MSAHLRTSKTPSPQLTQLHSAPCARPLQLDSARSVQIIRDIAVSRTLPGHAHKFASTAAVLQRLSGFGIILVGACAENQILAIHLLGALLGFAGGGVAQIIFTWVLYHEEQPSASAKKLLIARVSLNACFVLSAIIWGVGQAGVLPEPTEHLGEWGMWTFLLAWFYTFRFDLSDFCIATVSEDAEAGLMKNGVEGVITKSVI